MILSATCLADVISPEQKIINLQNDLLKIQYLKCAFKPNIQACKDAVKDKFCELYTNNPQCQG